MIRVIKNLLLHEPDKLLLLLAVILFTALAPQLSNIAHHGKWNEASLYGSLFNWASIQTAFLFAIYTFIIGRPGGFRDRFSNTKLYVDAMRYLRRTVFYSFAFSFVCLPFMFVAPDIEHWTGWKNIGLAYIAFAVFSVAGLYLFGRIVISMKIFMFVESETDKSKQKK